MGKTKCDTRMCSKCICLEFCKFIEFVSTIQLVAMATEMRTMAFVEKKNANCLDKCIDNFSIRDSTNYQLG